MTPQTKTIDEIVAELKALFPVSAIEWKPQAISRDKSKALAVPFIDARDVAERLDAVVGVFHWQLDHKTVAEQDAAGIGIKHPESGEWIWKFDVGYVGGADSDKEDNQVKGIKGTASDALKRAGYLWGIGRYLYSIPKQWLAWDEEKRQFVTAPKLPAWAVPSNMQSNGNGASQTPKMSSVQRAKLIELYQLIHIVEAGDALKGLDAMFFEQFQHGGKDATYEEAAKLTAQLLAESQTTPKKKK